jgi:S-adenosylmethionine decarboxylase
VSGEQIKLALTNNLTKSLGFNAYQLFTVDSDQARKDCIHELNDHHGPDFLIDLLEKSAELIQAKVLNISKELYTPHGTSVTMLVAEQRNTILGHLDKSHLTVHTYADLHLNHDICSFRLDFDLASCGQVTPLTTLPLLFDQVVCHLATIDYRVRGYGRDGDERLVFNDESISSILEYVPDEYLTRYDYCNANLPAHNLYHSKMVLKEGEMDGPLALSTKANSTGTTGAQRSKRLQEQMELLFREL